MEIMETGTNETFDFNHFLYGELSCYSKIFNAIANRYKLMVLKHENVLFMRFNLHIPYSCTVNEKLDFDMSNKEISRFFRHLKEEIYSFGIDVQYVWVREQGDIHELQSYHCILLLNGDILNHDYHLSQSISELWGRILQCHKEITVTYGNSLYMGYNPAQGLLMHRPYRDLHGEVTDQEIYEFNRAYNIYISAACDLSKVNHYSRTPYKIRKFGVSKISRKDEASFLTFDIGATQFILPPRNVNNINIMR